MSKVSFALVIHSHQPVGNFDHVFEEAYQKAYAPFVRTLLLHSRIRVCLHYSGILLEWLDQHHPEFFELLRQLIRRAQVELIGGGYYEPILPAVPDTDKVIQLRKLDAYLRDHFGVKPRGAWIAERVWEPGLAQPLAEARVEYTILDDTHFLAAGLEPFELCGTFITEEDGMPLRLVPSLKALRYAIPFREPEETLRILSEGKDQPDALLAMGDDCEKFGVWPGTYEHCYQNGWLERFFKAIEESQGWLETTTLSDFLAAHSPLGRIYLPTASYAEMMEWALPLRASTEFKACLEETERTPGGERFRRFLRGGMWRNFLSKYPEANQLHKLMLEVSRRWHDASQATPAGARPTGLLHQAQTHLLASQCNDAYWHGVFGGLYAPHLRSALLRNLIQAESLLDKLGGTGKNPVVRVTTKDFDVDGQEEVLVHHPVFAMVLRPADGGTISSLRFKPADVELINSLMRRPEPYHETVRRHIASHQAPKGRLASIHDRIFSKEANLDALLRYDHYFRHSFRTYVFPAAKTWQDFEALLLEENEETASGPWKFVAKDNPAAFEFRREALFRSNGNDLRLMALKEMTVKVAKGAWQLECRHSLSKGRAGGEPLALGVEMVFNLLAPNAPDRYFLANEIRRPLESKGEINAPNLVLVDEWQHVKISLEASPQALWWITPVETISQSESGFERVYQGSVIMAVWKAVSPSWRNFSGDLLVKVDQLGE